MIHSDGEVRAGESGGAAPLEDEQGERHTERDLGDTTTERDDTPVALFQADERQDAEERWRDIQSRFVDEPRAAVEAANALVADLLERLVASFNAERTRLEAQWDRGEDVTTEELRVVLQRYRSFFGRLLEV